MGGGGVGRAAEQGQGRGCGGGSGTGRPALQPCWGPLVGAGSHGPTPAAVGMVVFFRLLTCAVYFLCFLVVPASGPAPACLVLTLAGMYNTSAGLHD